MKKAFETVARGYEQLKNKNQEKRDVFEKKFEEKKTKTSQEIMSAKSPEDLIVIAQELEEQAREMREQERDLKKSEKILGEEYENAKNEIISEGHEEGNEMNKTFDESKAAEEALREKASNLETDRINAETEASQLAAIRAKISGKGIETSPENGE